MPSPSRSTLPDFVLVRSRKYGVVAISHNASPPPCLGYLYKGSYPRTSVHANAARNIGLVAFACETLKAMASWLDAHGYKWVAGSNGLWRKS